MSAAPSTVLGARMDLLVGYYLLGTLAFVVLDLAMGASIRVPGLGEATARWGYYAALLAVGGVALRHPRLAPWIGMGESLVNLVLAFLSILLPIWSLPDVLAAGGEPAEAVVGPEQLLGVFLAGVILILGLYRGARQVWPGERPGGGRVLAP